MRTIGLKPLHTLAAHRTAVHAVEIRNADAFTQNETLVNTLWGAR